MVSVCSNFKQKRLSKTPSLCRLCSAEDNLINLFTGDLKRCNFFRGIILYGIGIEIKPDDIVSKMVCQRCCEIAIKLHKYRTNALNNDKKLKSQYTPNNNQENMGALSNVYSMKDDLIFDDPVLIGISKFEEDYFQNTSSEISKNVSLTAKLDHDSTKINTLTSPKITVKMAYKHPTILKLEKKNPNIIIPEEVFPDHISPVISLDESEVTDWFQIQFENLQKKLSHITFKKVTTEDPTTHGLSIKPCGKEALTNKDTNRLINISSSNIYKNKLNKKNTTPIANSSKCSDTNRLVLYSTGTITTKLGNNSGTDLNLLKTKCTKGTQASDVTNGIVQSSKCVTSPASSNCSTLNSTEASSQSSNKSIFHNEATDVDSLLNRNELIEAYDFSNSSLRKRLKKLDEFFSDGANANKAPPNELRTYKNLQSRKSLTKPNYSSIDETLESVIRQSRDFSPEKEVNLPHKNSSNSVKRRKLSSNFVKTNIDKNSEEAIKNRVVLTIKNKAVEKIETFPCHSTSKETVNKKQVEVLQASSLGKITNGVQKAKKRTATQAQLSDFQSTSSKSNAVGKSEKKKNRRYYNDNTVTNFNDIELDLLNDINSNNSDAENLDYSLLESTSNPTDADNLFVLTSGKTLAVFICAVCSLVCDTKRQLVDHEKTHLTCKFCKKKLKNIQLLVEHLNDACVINVMKDDARVKLIRVDDVPSIVSKYQDAFEVDNSSDDNCNDNDNDMYINNDEDDEDDEPCVKEEIFNENIQDEVKIEQLDLKYENIDIDAGLEVICLSDGSDDEIEFSVVPRHTIVNDKETDIKYDDDDVNIIEGDECDDVYVFDAAFKHISSETDMIKTLFKKYYHGIIKFEKCCQTFKNTNRCVKRTSNNIIFLDRMYSELLIYTVPVKLESRPNISARFMPPMAPPAVRPLEYWGHKKPVDIKRCIKPAIVKKQSQNNSDCNATSPVSKQTSNIPNLPNSTIISTPSKETAVVGSLVPPVIKSDMSAAPSSPTSSINTPNSV